LGGPGALMPHLRTLLADRFRLEVHDETRQLSAYVLVHARGDRRLTQAERLALSHDWPP
jgi:uncharacterized protein (TIGR03435 family)